MAGLFLIDAPSWLAWIPRRAWCALPSVEIAHSTQKHLACACFPCMMARDESRASDDCRYD